MANDVTTARVNAVPLLDTLKAIRELGRARKDAGVDDEAVEFARMASKAIAWFEADEDGAFEEAVSLFNELQRMLPRIGEAPASSGGLSHDVGPSSRQDT